VSLAAHLCCDLLSCGKLPLKSFSLSGYMYACCVCMLYTHRCMFVEAYVKHAVHSSGVVNIISHSEVQSRPHVLSQHLLRTA
jgi:hypothetical protein